MTRLPLSLLGLKAHGIAQHCPHAHLGTMCKASVLQGGLTQAEYSSHKSCHVFIIGRQKLVAAAMLPSGRAVLQSQTHQPCQRHMGASHNKTSTTCYLYTSNNRQDATACSQQAMAALQSKCTPETQRKGPHAAPGERVIGKLHVSLAVTEPHSAERRPRGRRVSPASVSLLAERSVGHVVVPPRRICT